jgi:hypothetical protein
MFSSKIIMAKSWIGFAVLLSCLLLSPGPGNSGDRFDLKNQGRASTRVTLPLIALETTYEVEGFEPPHYPQTISIDVPPDCGGKIDAYGAAGEVLIGPKGWVGFCLVAANGTAHVDLRPKKGNKKNGFRTSLTIGSQGLGSTLALAAPYFPWIMANWDKLMETEKSAAIAIRSNFLTPYLNRYEVLDAPPGEEVRGVVFSDAEKHAGDRYWSFFQIEISLPPGERPLAECLLNVFIDRFDLRNKT